MQDLIYALEGTIIEKEYMLKGEFQTNLDEIKNRVKLKCSVTYKSASLLFRIA